MGESESVSDRAAIVPAPTIEMDEVIEKDDKDSAESGSSAGKVVSERSDDNDGGSNDHRFNLRTRKPSAIAEKQRSSPAQGLDDKREVGVSYLGIHGWIKLKEGLPLTCGTFRDITSSPIELDASGSNVSPSFTGKASLISNSSKSDDVSSAIAAKKAALQKVVVRSVKRPASKEEKAMKSIKKSKQAIKSGLVKSVLKTAIKAGKKAKLSLGAAKAITKRREREPSPFKPVVSMKKPPEKAPTRKSASYAARISSYKSSRSVAKELEKQKGQKPGEFNITKITFDDVLLGRGNNLVTYEGNIRYREIVLKHRDRYIAAPRVEKGQIAKTVIQTVWNRGGRFLESKNNDQTNWREAELPRLLEKSTQALREKHAWKEHPERRDGVLRH